MFAMLNLDLTKLFKRKLKLQIDVFLQVVSHFKAHKSIRKNIFSCMLMTPLLLTPFIYSGELYNGVINAKQIWFYGAMAILLAGAGLQLMFPKRPLQIALNRVDLVLLLFYSYLTIRAATTPYMPMLHNTRFINYSLCMTLYFIIRIWFVYEESDKRESPVVNELASGSTTSLSLRFLIVNFLILTGLGQAIWGLLQFYDVLPNFNGNFKITGTFYNPAPYSLYLAVIFPMALGKVLFNDGVNNKGIASPFIFKFSYYLSFATVITILLVLPVTMIRAAWLGAFTGSLLVLQYKYQFVQIIKQYLNTNTKKLTALTATLTVIVLFGAGLYHLKKDSVNGKMFIWEVTLGKIAEKPLFGYGVGRFEAEYNNWQAEYFQTHPQEMDGTKGWVAGNTKYAFNEFLEMTSETGVVGFILFLLVIASTFQVMKELKIQNEPPQSNFSESIFFHSSLISFLFCAIISFPFYSLPTLIMFFVILANLSAQKSSCQWFSFLTIYKSRKLKYAFQYSISFILIGLSFLMVYSARQHYKAYYAWSVSEIFTADMRYDEAGKLDETIYPQLKFNGDFLQSYGEVLSKDEQYTLALMKFIQASNYTSCEKLYIDYGNVYRALKVSTPLTPSYPSKFLSINCGSRYFSSEGFVSLMFCMA